MRRELESFTCLAAASGSLDCSCGWRGGTLWEVVRNCALGVWASNHSFPTLLKKCFRLFCVLGDINQTQTCDFLENYSMRFQGFGSGDFCVL